MSLPTWLPAFKKHIHGLKIRKGESSRVNPTTKTTTTLYTIDVKLEGSDKFRAAIFPPGFWTFESQATRDAIFDALENPKE